MTSTDQAGVLEVKAVETVRTAFPFTTTISASPTLAAQQKAASASASQAVATTTAESAAAVGGALEPTAQTGRGNSFKNEDDVFDEKFVKTFDQEGTPAVISGRASLSDITISDDETVSWNNYFNIDYFIFAYIFTKVAISKNQSSHLT